MKQIFLIMGSIGEYSDRREWPVRAFIDELKAGNFLLELSSKSRELILKTREDDDLQDSFWDNRVNAWQVHFPEDPNLQREAEYTCPKDSWRYWVTSVDLEED